MYQAAATQAVARSPTPRSWHESAQLSAEAVSAPLTLWARRCQSTRSFSGSRGRTCWYARSTATSSWRRRVHQTARSRSQGSRCRRTRQTGTGTPATRCALASRSSQSQSSDETSVLVERANGERGRSTDHQRPDLDDPLGQELEGVAVRQRPLGRRGADRAELGVRLDALAEDGAEAGVGLQPIELRRELLLGPDVVVVQERDVLAGGRLEAGVARGADAATRVAEVARAERGGPDPRSPDRSRRRRRSPRRPRACGAAPRPRGCCRAPRSATGRGRTSARSR